MKISDIIHERLVIFMDDKDMKQAINNMVQKAYDEGKVYYKEDFEKAVLAREEIVSTGIGMGVAIPHAKLPNINNFFIVIGIAKNGLDWDSIDRKPVRAIFMIGGPDEKQAEYLKILAKLTLLVKNEERREKLFEANSAQDVIAVFDKF